MNKYILTFIMIFNLTIALCSLAGCGQKGPLFLPSNETKQTDED